MTDLGSAKNLFQLPPGQDEEPHFEISRERPERMLESRRSISLDEEVRKPRRPIAGNERAQQTEIFTCDKSVDYQHQCE